MFYFLSAIFLVFLLLSIKLIISKQRYKNLPPSPPALPIIGHLHLVKVPVHRTLQKVSNHYGPIVSLLFGSRRVVLVSSPTLVEECFNKNDIILANRPRSLAGKHLNYNYTTIGASSYGHHWRNLRRLMALEIVSTNKLNSSLSIRHEEIKILLKGLYENSVTSFAKVEMKSRISDLSFNMTMRMISGKRYFGEQVENMEEAKRFRGVVRELFEVSGASDPGNFLPFLRWIDYKGLEKSMLSVKKKADELCQGLIDEHRKNRNNPSGQATKTVIGNMLSLQESEPETYSDDIIKGLILTMVAAGIDTTSATLEWGMALLLNHPEVVKKARTELDKTVGTDRLVEESDCSRMPYIQSIVDETQRLYPAAPLLVPHEASDDCTIGGYDVPRGTMLMVNAWAVHRDPTAWDDPNDFRPERFEGLDAATYKLIPFGVGRRACPGAGLANRVMALAVAALIQCFDWKRLGEEQVDMSEGTGLTMPKVLPLEAMCKARESMVSVLNEL